MLIVPSAYLAPIAYYAGLYAAREVVEDDGEHYVKQTLRNRCYIATPDGAQALTIPVVRSGAARTAVGDIRISDHGNWRRLHWQALVSAYESSPYFEYYADDFRPLYCRKFDFLADFNEVLRHVVLDALQLDIPVRRTAEYIAEVPAGAVDLRTLTGKPAGGNGMAVNFPSYYQVFAGRTGFLPNLSIVDLLFNMGPESRLVLRACVEKAY